MGPEKIKSELGEATVKRFCLFLILLTMPTWATACTERLSDFALTQLAGLTAASNSVWQPAVNTTWQIQFTGKLRATVNAALYDIDLFDDEASVVAALHVKSRKVICYLSAGSWEDWRPDAKQFPTSVIGNDYAGWPGEKWLDIRQIDLLAPILRARLDQCKAKGFDGVDPDNVDGYTNETGFALTAQDQLNFNKWLASEAHARGLAIGLKNDSDQISDLLPYFEWTITEDCFAEDWCDQVLPFIQSGKPVFAVEYTDRGMTTRKFCAQAKAMHISAILKHRNLDAWRRACG